MKAMRRFIHHANIEHEVPYVSAEHFRAKAREYTLRMKDTVDAGALRELQRLEQSFTGLANNEEWLAHRVENSLLPGNGGAAEVADKEAALRTAAQIEEHILRCLGAAVIMQWNTIPTKLQRELFDTAGSVGDLLSTAQLRGQIARFLHEHKDDERHCGLLDKRAEEDTL
jgi:hypothetical protein